MVETSSPAVAVVVEALGGSSQKRAPESRPNPVCCRNVARAITTHRFELWAVLEAGREWITGNPNLTPLLPTHTGGAEARSIVAIRGHHTKRQKSYAKHDRQNAVSSRFVPTRS